jgi:DNA-binding protein H-NS
LRDATREAIRDLDSLKLVKPEQSSKVTVLKYELTEALAKDHQSFAKQARSISKQAKQASAQHRGELMQMKKTAAEASLNLRVARTRLPTRKARAEQPHPVNRPNRRVDE